MHLRPTPTIPNARKPTNSTYSMLNTILLPSSSPIATCLARLICTTDTRHPWAATSILSTRSYSTPNRTAAASLDAPAAGDIWTTITKSQKKDSNASFAEEKICTRSSTILKAMESNSKLQTTSLTALKGICLPYLRIYDAIPPEHCYIFLIDVSK